MKRLALVILITLTFFQSRAQEFPVRGFHIDFRTQVMTLDAMKDFATELSGMGINKIVMEWEATFPFDRHAVICNPLAFSKDEIKEFISHCEDLGIDVIPLQQCFGHVEYILRHDRYSHLKESWQQEISQICPLKPGSAELFADIFAEVAALHPSEYFHIGGDETWLLGKCPHCRKYVEKHGKSGLFVDYVVKMCDAVTALGKRPVLWADIITKYPEAIGKLPKNAILVDWNYGWSIKHFGDLDKVLASGLEIWGAPAIRSHPDNYYSTDWTKHFNNQRDFIPYARETGYRGMIMTSWSTSGGYGFFWDQHNVITEMDPVRQVFPMKAFRMLIAMYGEALNTMGSVDPEEFVLRYCRERFGFDDDDAKRFWIAFNTPQTIILRGKGQQGKGEDVCLIRDKAVADRDALYAMKVKRNKAEFDMFLLMWDIRVQFLEYKSLEAEMNSVDFTCSDAPEMLERLRKNVLSVNGKLSRRFSAMCKGYLKPQEIEYLNALRLRQVSRTEEMLKNLIP